MEKPVEVIVKFTDIPSIEGLSYYFAGYPDYIIGGDLEKSGLGFWLTKWRVANSLRRYSVSHIFVPWCNCLYVEIKGEKNNEKTASKK